MKGEGGRGGRETDKREAHFPEVEMKQLTREDSGVARQHTGQGPQHSLEENRGVLVPLRAAGQVGGASKKETIQSLYIIYSSILLQCMQYHGPPYVHKQVQCARYNEEKHTNINHKDKDKNNNNNKPKQNKTKRKFSPRN